MHLENNKKLFTILSLVLLYLSFGHNFFHAVNPLKFESTGSTSDALVIGRLVETRNNDLLSQQGRMGRYMDIDGDMNSNQTKLYLNQIEGGKYLPYDSTFGLQGMVIGVVDGFFTIIGVGEEEKLKLYHLILALFFSIIITCVILILYDDIGFTASCLILVSIIFSRFLVYYGKSFYWMLPVMFLPMLSVFYACKGESVGKGFNLLAVSFLAMILVMLDALMGYEFISTVMLSTLTPLVYFAVKDDWNHNVFIRRFFVIGIFALFGFIFALMMHVQQLELFTGSYSSAIDIIKERILARTYTNPEDYAGTAYLESQQSSVFYVLYVYLIKGGTFRIKVPFVLWIMMLGYITYKVKSDWMLKDVERYKNIKALIITSWFSMMAPLSWFVLAKSHSAIHTPMNYLIWHLPFMIFVFALFGLYWEKPINSGVGRLYGKFRSTRTG